jgi:hypothetical protein
VLGRCNNMLSKYFDLVDLLRCCHRAVYGSNEVSIVGETRTSWSQGPHAQILYLIRVSNESLSEEAFAYRKPSCSAYTIGPCSYSRHLLTKYTNVHHHLHPFTSRYLVWAGLFRYYISSVTDFKWLHSGLKTSVAHGMIWYSNLLSLSVA